MIVDNSDDVNSSGGIKAYQSNKSSDKQFDNSYSFDGQAQNTQKKMLKGKIHMSGGMGGKPKKATKMIIGTTTSSSIS